MKPHKSLKLLAGFGLLVGYCAMLSACSSKRAQTDASAEPQQTDAQRIESLSQALSRSQSRIEELDARLAAMSDKLDSTRLELDNVTNSRPLKTKAVTKPVPIDEIAEEADEKPVSGKRASVAPAVGAVLVTSPDEPSAQFRQAMNLYKGGQYTQSQADFSKFVENNPEHVLAGSAQFYTAESYFMLGEYSLALPEYEKVLTAFSSSPRAASAMVRKAHCLQALGNSTESDKVMKLARQLYAGNPSLDWSGPNAASSVKKEARVSEVKSKASESLDAEPMTGAADTAPEAAHEH